MSKYAFPPTSTDNQTISLLLQVYKTSIADKSAIYISTPMTSGLRYMEAFAKLPTDAKVLDQELRRLLYNQNCQHARSVAAMTRLHFPTSIVIDPTHIEVPGWEQNDYLTFWRQVIVDYTSVVRFVNNWHYSNGCAYEYLVGALTNKILIDEQENTIQIYEGRDLIAKAYEEHLRNGYDNDFLLNVVKSLDKLIHSEDGA
jgi:hypothetical protein